MNQYIITRKKLKEIIEIGAYKYVLLKNNLSLTDVIMKEIDFYIAFDKETPDLTIQLN